MTKKITESKVNKLKSLIEKGSKVIITVHRSPDGDALGSMLGWYHYLRSKGKKVELWVPDPFPLHFSWLPGIDKVKIFDENLEDGIASFAAADLIFCLDFNSFSRTGKEARYISSSKAKKVMIDHHRQPDTTFTLRLYNIEASSTCEIIYELIDALGDKPSKKSAECLFCGLITDTGSFKFATSKRTLEVAGKLLEAGVNNSRIHNNINNTKSVDNLKLRGYALAKKLVVFPENNAGYIALSEKELKKYNYQKGDTEGLVNEILSIKGMKMAVLFSEGKGEIRISFRSIGKFDVNQIARKYFGGGGHMNAAGARSLEDLKMTEEKIIKIINENAKALASSEV